MFPSSHFENVKQKNDHEYTDMEGLHHDTSFSHIAQL